MPGVFWAISGSYQVQFKHKVEDMSQSVFDTCFEFVVEVALLIGEAFRASSILQQPSN